MELHLVDMDQELVDIWGVHFQQFQNVYIACSDILDVAENTIVSPANSYGYMDGGIDAQYVKFFGYSIQEKVRHAISLRVDGYLPVGSALLVETGHTRISYLITAPTMLGLGQVPAPNSFFAMAAVLKIVHEHRDKISKVFCPGLGTGVGGVPPEMAAEEMAKNIS
jgi:O-acetyl-ADP-ribose deacetylase (regulator of RNase III)